MPQVVNGGGGGGFDNGGVNGGGFNHGDGNGGGFNHGGVDGGGIDNGGVINGGGIGIGLKAIMLLILARVVLASRYAFVFSAMLHCILGIAISHSFVSSHRRTLFASKLDFG